MKRTSFYLGAAITALIVGLIGVRLLGFFPTFENFQIIESSDLQKGFSAVEPIPITANLPSLHFTKTFNSCSIDSGYIQGYITNDGQHLSEGNECFFGKNKKTGKEFNKLINESKKTIERNTERVVLEFEGENGKYFKILYYNGGQCFDFIDAPNLELALEFEKWQESQK